jgi:hypothetical protein
VDTEPPLAFFIQRSTPPEPDLSEVRGEWRFESEWPLARGRELALPLETANLTGRAGRPLEATLPVRGDVGATAHIRGSYPPPYGLPIDQRPDEVYSLLYDWPVEEELEILGNPVLAVTLRSSQPVAFVSAKLCEVLEDGTSVMVSRGILNLTHRDSHTTPEPLVPGETYEVSIELDATSWVFEVGHRIRLTIAGSDWPNAWPPPEASELTVVLGRTRLILPKVAGEPPITERPSFVPIEEDDASPSAGDPESVEPTWQIEHDIYARETRVVVHQQSMSAVEDPWSARRTDDVRAGVKALTPGFAWVESATESEVVWPEVTARTSARLQLRSDSTTYYFDLTLDVFEDDQLISTRHWETVTPRKLQ